MERNRLIGPHALDSRMIWGRGPSVPGRLRGRLSITITPQANLHVGQQVFLVGRLDAGGRLRGELYSLGPLHGDALIQVMPDAALRIDHALAGMIEPEFDLNGHLWPPLTIRGDMSADFDPQGDLTVKRALRSEVQIVGAFEGDLFAPKVTRLGGDIGTTVVLSGNLTRFSMRALSGDVLSNARYEGDLYKGVFRSLTGHVEADIDVAGNLSIIPIPEYSLVGWGDNTYGQRNVPAGNSFIQVACGWWFSLALDITGTIYAWGFNGDGQVTGKPSGNGFLAIGASATAGLAIDINGSIHAWGNNNGNVVSGKPSGTGFKKVVGGRAHALALKDDGSLVAWGDNSLGQVSGKPSETGFIDIAAAADVCFAINADGVVYAWGATTGSASSTRPLGTTTGHLAVAAQEKVGLAIDGSRQLAPWGADIAENSFFVANTPPGSDYIDVAIAGLGTAASGAAIHGDGSIEAWGNNTYGQVGTKPSGTGHGGVAGGARHFIALAPQN